MLLLSCTATGDDRDLQVVSQSCQCLVGIAFLHTIVIHTGKQNLSSTAFLGFMGPFKESAFHTFPTAFHIAVPAVGIEAGIDGANTNLRTKLTGDLIDELRSADGCRVHAHLISSRMEQSFHILQGIDATAHGKGDVDLLSHTCHHLCEGLTTLERGGDIEEHQFVGTSIAVGFPQFHRVACMAQVDKVRSLDGLSVFDVQAGDDSFGKSGWVYGVDGHNGHDGFIGLMDFLVIGMHRCGLHRRLYRRQQQGFLRAPAREYPRWKTHRHWR